MALLQQAKNRIVARGAGIVCMVASNRDVMFIVDDGEVFERVKNHTWLLDTNYLVATINSEKVALHHFVKGKHETLWIDHINRNTLDNREANLRYATPTENRANQPKRPNMTSRFKGVYFDKRENKWRAEIRKQCAEGRGRELKVFKNEVAAAQWYNNKAIEKFGNYALLNDFDEFDFMQFLLH